MTMSNLVPSAMVRHNLTREGKNYQIWCKSMETCLMANDLWDAIVLEPGCFEDYKIWRKKNAMALCVICTACDEELSNHFILSKWNAKEIWDDLRANFGQSEPAPAQEETSTRSEQPVIYTRIEVMAISNLACSGIIRHNLTCGGENYEIWSKSIKTYLKANDLWDAIDGKVEPEPGDNGGDYKTWQKKNAMALCIICTTCDDEKLCNHFISSELKAKEMWDFLRISFGKKQAQGQEESSSDQPGRIQKGDIAYLQKAVRAGDWSKVKRVLDRNRELLRLRITRGKKTVLHLAVTAGHEEIVKNLLKLKEMTDDVLVAEDVDGYTALAIAARDGLPSVAKLLVEKNKNLVHLATDNGELPVILASATGHDETTRYLYTQTDSEFLNMQGYVRIKKKFIPSERIAVALFTNCIAAKIYDVALSLLKLWPSLAKCSDSEGHSCAHIMAQTSTSFSGGDDLVLLKRWIYYYVSLSKEEQSGTYLGISVQLPALPQPANTDIESQPDDIKSQPGQPDDVESQTTEESQNVPSDFRNNFCAALGKLFMLFSKFGFMEQIIKQKFRHTQALKLLEMICQEITDLEERRKILFLALENGLIELVFELSPDMLWCFDEYGRNPFSVAVLQRQEKIFKLLYEMGVKKNLLVGYKDKFGNNTLHHAAMLAPPLKLRKQSGAALQFQRELHWFQEVEKIVDPKCIEARNTEGKTPRDLFTIQHDDLRKEGERWMKDTASSSMIAATLIATMTFTAVFTVPGGNDQNTGFVMFLEDSSPMVTPFMIFIIADALSLVSSTASVLSFLQILTARFAEEDFRESLPRTMIFGLFTLFVSMTTMMVAFSATLYVILHKQINWVIYPIATCGGIPVLLFLWFQFRLLFRISKSTYGRGILNKKNKKKVGKFFHNKIKKKLFGKQL